MNKPKGPKAFIISLSRAKERREHAISQAEKAGLDFEIVEAVDARDFRDANGQTDWDALRKVQEWDNSGWGTPFRASEIAIYASHAKVYQRILNLDLPYAFVLEDDFQLRDAPYSLLDVAAELEEHQNQFAHCLLHHEHLWFCSDYRVQGPFKNTKTLNVVRATGLISVASAVSNAFCRFFVESHSVMDRPHDHQVCELSRHDDPNCPEEAYLPFLQSSFPVCGSAGFPSTNE